MTKFLIRRLIFGLIVILLGMMVVYTVIRSMPADYVKGMARRLVAGNQLLKFEDVYQQLLEDYGLDKGIIPGYAQWVGNAVQGKFGNSWHYNMPVTQKFSDVIWWSVLMSSISLILEVIICIPLGILAARKQYSKTDYGVTIFALITLSFPTFFLAAILKFVFALQLRWLPLVYLRSATHQFMTPMGKVVDIARHLIMPIITLAFVHVGALTRYTRTNMLDVLNTDYIRTARAKGLPEKVVINKHAFRNTLIPLVTYMSYLLPAIFTGAMITETMFSIPGIGKISFDAMIMGDIPFAMFYTLFIQLLTQLSLILADIMYAAVDPRVRVN
ncbi:MAG: ABC transporter permease [Clostridiales bacterium]|nr:ABC transporter permease [Clostridiales bacterium]